MQRGWTPDQQRITPQKSVEDAPNECVRGALRSIRGTPG
jgi:hypothetical protein